MKKMSKRYLDAFTAHRRSSDRLANSKRRVDNFLAHLFNAMKDHEKDLLEYRKTATKLQKFGS